MKKVLVSGAGGFVGKHLVRELLANNYEVVGVDTSPSSEAGNASDYQHQVANLTQQADVAKIDFVGIDAVIHLAGLAAVGPSFDRPMEYLQTNVGIEVNLFERALRQNTKPRFLIISTGGLYDSKAPLPLTENSPVLPSSPYAVSKLSQEDMALYYSQRGIDAIIARPFNHIGPGQNPGFIVPDIAQQIIAVEKGESQSIKAGNLDAKRDYTDVRDIARAYRLLIDKGAPGEIYNICSGKAVSGHEIVDGLLNAAGSGARVETDPARMRPSDNPEIYGDNSKISSFAGWQPQISLEQTLTDVIADWRSR